MALPGMLTHKPQSCLVSTFLFFCSFFLHRYSLSSPHFRFPQLSLKPLNIRKLACLPPFFFFLLSSKTSIFPLFLTGTPIFLVSSPSLYPLCLAHHSLKLHHSSHLSLTTLLFPVQQKKSLSTTTMARWSRPCHTSQQLAPPGSHPPLPNKMSNFFRVAKEGSTQHF